MFVIKWFKILIALFTLETKHILQKSEVIFKVQESFHNVKMDINVKGMSVLF